MRVWRRQDDAGAAPDASAQGRGGVKGLGKKGNQHAARLAAEARQALAVRIPTNDMLAVNPWRSVIPLLCVSKDNREFHVLFSTAFNSSTTPTRTCASVAFFLSFLPFSITTVSPALVDWVGFHQSVGFSFAKSV